MRLTGTENGLPCMMVLSYSWPGVSCSVAVKATSNSYLLLQKLTCQYLCCLRMLPNGKTALLHRHSDPVLESTWHLVRPCVRIHTVQPNHETAARSAVGVRQWFAAPQMTAAALTTLEAGTPAINTPAYGDGTAKGCTGEMPCLPSKPNCHDRGAHFR